MSQMTLILHDTNDSSIQLGVSKILAIYTISRVCEYYLMLSGKEDAPWHRFRIFHHLTDLLGKHSYS